MKHFNAFLGGDWFRKYVKNESGHYLIFEWSKLVLVFFLLLFILLPDLITIGRVAFHGHNASSYAVERAADQGQMNATLASEVTSYLQERDLGDCDMVSDSARSCYELYGTADMRGMNSPNPDVEVQVIVKHRPMILQVIPNLRLSDSLAIEDGVIQMSFTKLASATPYVREGM